MIKGRLYQAERAQLNFAAAASHELRTPLHQINAAAALLHQSLDSLGISHPAPVPSNEMSELGITDIAAINPSPSLLMADKVEALAQLEIIEMNGINLSQILDNIIDTLDVGKVASRPAVYSTSAKGQKSNLSDVLEHIVEEAINNENQARRVSGQPSLNKVEVIMEILPRERGGWIMAADPDPIAR